MNNKNMELSYEILKESVENAVAFRLRRRLQPAGGSGDKVFPPTYEGGKYAWEERIIDGEKIPCVILDSVQSQANRMELALLRAWEQEEFTLPVISVNFQGHGMDDLGKITSLEVPHRIADAILRDSKFEGKSFRESLYGKYIDTAKPNNATNIFGICPTALLFGFWDSTGPMGGLGTKFQRMIISEVFAIRAQSGIRTSSRIDPLQIQLGAGPLYEDKNNEWTLDPEKAKKDKKGESLKLKTGRPSEVVHGNIAPTIEETNGGITMSYALQTVVLSLTALRNLSFPLENRDSESQKARNILARTVLAALGLCAATKSAEENFDLRSRCLLYPEAPASWEILRKDGSSESFTLSGKGASTLVETAVKEAQKNDLPWHEKEIILTPSEKLISIVKKSRDLVKKSAEPEEA